MPRWEDQRDERRRSSYLIGMPWFCDSDSHQRMHRTRVAEPIRALVSEESINALLGNYWSSRQNIIVSIMLIGSNISIIDPPYNKTMPVVDFVVSFCSTDLMYLLWPSDLIMIEQRFLIIDAVSVDSNNFDIYYKRLRMHNSATRRSYI